MTDDYCARRKIARRQTFAGFQTGPAEGTVADAMSEPLRRTIVYEDAGDGDGWMVAHASPRSGAQSARAQPDEEARENVIGASESCSRPGSPPELPDRTDSDSLELTVAA